MNLSALELPESNPELALALDAHMVGPSLAALVGQLEALAQAAPAGASRSRPTLAQVLGAKMEAVIAGGLRSLAEPTLRQLLRHPRLLLELQAEILERGGDYWQETAAGLPGAAARTDRGWADLRRAITGTAWPARLARIGLLAAAVVVAAGLIHLLLPPRSVSTPTWGWERPGALRAELSAREYLLGLSASAREWFAQRPDAPPALAQRLHDLRAGCTLLILSPHSPLVNAADRDWLIERCRTWAARLEAHIRDLESGRTALEVRAEADDTVTRLVAALKARAEEV